KPADCGRRSAHGLSGRLPRAGNRVRRHQRPAERGPPVEGLAPQLFAARGGEHVSPDDVSGGAEEPQPRAEKGRGDMTSASDHPEPGSATAMTGPEYLPRGHDLRSITDAISQIVLKRPVGFGWLGSMAFALGLLTIFTAVIIYLLIVGVGIWGINIPVGWAFTITDFVWWIGIGHAGTLISAILLLHQRWRTSINRIAEAMTIFALMCAGLFPLIHLGRPWFFYWLLPYPNTMRMWPQFRSALIWDVFAVSTYFLVSLLFWYLGMVPDFATLRDRAKSSVARTVYWFLALGWRNSA